MFTFTSSRRSVCFILKSTQRKKICKLVVTDLWISNIDVWYFFKRTRDYWGQTLSNNPRAIEFFCCKFLGKRTETASMLDGFVCSLETNLFVSPTLISNDQSLLMQGLRTTPTPQYLELQTYCTNCKLLLTPSEHWHRQTETIVFNMCIYWTTDNHQKVTSTEACYYNLEEEIMRCSINNNEQKYLTF